MSARPIRPLAGNGGASVTETAELEEDRQSLIE